MTATLSEILEAVGSLLTEGQKDQLAAQLISSQLTLVHPGDLITADYFNTMTANINDLAIRVSKLEGTTGGPVITGLQPKGEIMINSLLSVSGTGFNDIPEYNVVTLGGKQITQFNQASSKSELIFPVPDLFTGLPKTVDLTVANDGKTSPAFPVQLKAQPREQKGEFLVTEAYLQTGTLAADSDEKFGWDVLASTTLDDQLTLSLVALNADPAASAAQWQAAAVFSPVSPLAIVPGQTRRVDLTIHVPPGAKAADLQLKVVGIDGTTMKSSPPVPWRVGKSLDPSNGKAILTATEVGDANTTLVANMTTSSGATYQQGFTFKRLNDTQLGFQVKDTRPAGDPKANFTCTATLTSGDGDWTVTPVFNATKSGVNPGGDFSFVIDLKNKAGAANAEYLLRVEAKQTASGNGITPYTSYTIFPIKLTA